MEAALILYLVGAGYGRVGKGQAKRCGGFEIDLSQYRLIDSAEYDDSK
jgi:hypothetical protein